MQRPLFVLATVWALFAVAACRLTKALVDKDKQLQLYAADVSNELWHADRVLLANADCRRIHPSCTRCFYTRRSDKSNNATTTVLVCAACQVTGWRLKGGQSPTCECAPGYYPGSVGTCGVCPQGKYCPGRGATAPQSCPPGLATILAAARTVDQCMTTPGFGRVPLKLSSGVVIMRAQLCPPGTFNTGGNSMGCKSCAPGLTTIKSGSSTITDCLAPAGYYVGSGSAKKCPKGTFTSGFNNQPFCNPCNMGVTTPTEGAISAADCSLATRGNYLVTPDLVLLRRNSNSSSNGTSSQPNIKKSEIMEPVLDYMAEAAPCPVNTYQDSETDATTCMPCPNGLRTEFEGATGVPLCLAPPGMELKPEADNITDCPRGWYKTGWNLNPCVPCGEGQDTATEGSVDADACYVPPGFGVLTDAAGEVNSVIMCVHNNYGRPVPTYDVKTARCYPCPANTATRDTLTGTDSSTGYTALTDCYPLPGTGFQTDGTVQPCRIGTWSVGGWVQRECKSCPAAYTTLAEGSSNSSYCVVQQGWAIEDSIGLPHPCNKDTYSVGGTAANPKGKCVPCPAGWGTQEAASVNVTECDVCVAGHGGPYCEKCFYGYYSYGGSVDDCRLCPNGLTSPSGSDSVSDCVGMWPQDGASWYTHIALSDESYWSDRPAGDASEAVCKAQCQEGCIMYRYGGGSNSPAAAKPAASSGGDFIPNRCQILFSLAPGQAAYSARAAVGFKAYSNGAVYDYSFYYIPESLTVGELLRDAGANRKLEECLEACTKREECVLVRVTGGNVSALESCRLYSGEIDPEWLSGYRISARQLLTDGFVVSTVG